ncbi:MAG: AAA family ATPase [Candidatus Villigracilaceae bacterium]
MIPISLRISGFLSYCEPVELDFTAFDLACISGPNGAGKSSLLDAITWALFGEARQSGEMLINAQSKAAEVTLTFAYEDALYRVQRSLPRGKSTLLEFFIQDADSGVWRPLTERSTRETQARIVNVLRLDYETFVNVSFFLQGKADQFARQTAARRKEVLASILGLEMWEVYRERAADRRKEVERELEETEGRLAEIHAELAEEPARRARLSELVARLNQVTAARKTAESALDTLRRAAAALLEQRKIADAMAERLGRLEQNLSELENRLQERERERQQMTELLQRADQIQAAYQAWQKARNDLAHWEEVAARFREYETYRRPLLEQIAVERARLEQEQRMLSQKAAQIEQDEVTSRKLQAQLEATRQNLAEAERQLAEREQVEQQIADGHERLAKLDAENRELKTQMDELKALIDSLEKATGVSCPLCRQPLSEEHRLATLGQLQAEGKAKGDRFRANKTEMAAVEKSLADFGLRLNRFAQAEQNRQAAFAVVTQLTERLESLQKLAAEWHSAGAPRLAEVTRLLENEAYALEARRQLVEIEAQLKTLGYDSTAHEATRQAEVQGRAAEDDFRRLESARAVSLSLEREITALHSQIENLRAEIQKERAGYEQALQALRQAGIQEPDVNAAEQQLFDLQEQENRIHQEVGAARQQVTVLDTLRQRKAALESQGDELRRKLSQYKTLERAFSKDGVPALLIEQALPQIEEKANDLLDRLSNGTMSVRFVTQTDYKDKKRTDLKETLDIQISDGAGMRNYEMFSGGEAFRVNFAIRLALSEVLAQRKGARLQTLVIDEGFGSQDTQGRQRLIEAINLIRGDFAKILVITHLDELKDAFPTRIEVEKTESGSAFRVV